VLQVFFLSGCGYDYYIKDEGIVAQQRQLFNQLCNADDRSVIYQRVKASGYLLARRGLNSCQDGWDPIFKYGYQYAECTETSITGFKLPDDIEVFHFTLEPKGHPECGTGEKHFIVRSRRFYRLYSGNSPNYKETNLGNSYKKEHKTQLQDKCLVVKKIEKPESQYLLLRTDGFYDENEALFYDEFYKKYKYEQTTKKGVIGFSSQQIIDRISGKVLSKNSNYIFFPKGRRYSYKTSIKCNENKKISPLSVLETNIKTNK